MSNAEDEKYYLTNDEISWCASTQPKNYGKNWEIKTRYDENGKTTCYHNIESNHREAE